MPPVTKEKPGISGLPRNRVSEILILKKDDVFSDMVVNVVQTQWVAEKIGVVKESVKVNIYSPEGGDPFKVEASEELTQAEVDDLP